MQVKSDCRHRQTVHYAGSQTGKQQHMAILFNFVGEHANVATADTLCAVSVLCCTCDAISECATSVERKYQSRWLQALQVCINQKKGKML